MKKSKSLRVPLCTQPNGVGWCVPAAARMVMAYHGDDLPLKIIAREMGVPRHGGVDSMQAAIYLLRRGYDVRIVGWVSQYPASFSRLRGPLPADAFLAWASRDVGRTSAYRLACRLYGYEFVKRGGIIEPRPTTLQDIRDAVERREPPIVFVNVTTLWHRKMERFTHAVVPVSVSAASITLLDPSLAEGRSRYGTDVFLHAFYRAEGESFLIRPKR